jgi:hypothetical protein
MELREYFPTEAISICRGIVDSRAELAKPVSRGRSNRPISESAQGK